MQQSQLSSDKWWGPSLLYCLTVSTSQEMLTLGIPALRIISISFVMAAITILCGYFASGLGNGIINMISAAIRQLDYPAFHMAGMPSGLQKSLLAFTAIACHINY